MIVYSSQNGDTLVDNYDDAVTICEFPDLPGEVQDYILCDDTWSGCVNDYWS